ncbi:phosphopantothenoylcysteine decarboxylase [Gracilibacillus boraciitolerans JCM 21714]|uniref:Phosphopantothenoylcysteine decarboxylase n=1 Tax=Gracilibacillus boraciitolerans JCM 21714 TaxID=1298598 RepID=W4VFT9_9BACI|nr:phosphopantothenoylcysteine decarboxylase [Gracilibacillus boraciitolerans JCM 21714]
MAPATANLIGKIANGIATDMLTTTLLATQVPIYIAPAMNVHMYQHPAVIENMKKLESWGGYRFIEPGGDGYLACGYIGRGRLEEPEKMVELIDMETNRTIKWKNKKVLITLGQLEKRLILFVISLIIHQGKWDMPLPNPLWNMGGQRFI